MKLRNRKAKDWRKRRERDRARRRAELPADRARRLEKKQDSLTTETPERRAQR